MIHSYDSAIIVVIPAYMPAADRPYEEKSDTYEKLQKTAHKEKSKGPPYIIGDRNARLIYPATHTEEDITGKHTMHIDSSTLEHLTEVMTETRELFIEFCAADEFKVGNAMFPKALDKTATYRTQRRDNRYHRTYNRRHT